MSDQPKSMYLQLAESVGPMAKLPNNGAAYHTGEQVITHLNRVLGPENWSFHILGCGMEDDSDECWVFGQVTATIEGVTVVKQDYGSQALKRSRQSGKFISKGEDRKSAATDALKRCARLLGVGLDAWANERAPSWRPDEHDEDERREVADEMRAEKRNGGRPTPAPTTDEATRAAAMVGGAPSPRPPERRPSLLAAIARGTAKARALGVDMRDIETDGLTDGELDAVVADLASTVRAASAARDKARAS